MCGISAEMKTHFTVMPLLLRLQRQKRIPTATPFDSHDRDNEKSVEYQLPSFDIQELSAIRAH